MILLFKCLLFACVKVCYASFSRLVTQRGLSLTADAAVSYPTVPEPEHGEAGGYPETH